ncbi:MAG TPA: D-alanine--D-alanine ligase, partial [Blastococcus sp.]
MTHPSAERSTATSPGPEAARSGLRAVVLSGGLNFEREVSLSSGTQVWEELARAGVDAELRDADADLLPGLAASPADAVFIALHGATGEDGALRAVLDLAGVPYVGSPAAACRLAWDKPAAKSVVRAAGATTPDWVALPHSTFRELGAGAVLDLMVARLGLPLIVKPASGGSALGVQKLSSVEELPAAMVS